MPCSHDHDQESWYLPGVCHVSAPLAAPFSRPLPRHRRVLQVLKFKTVVLVTHQVNMSAPYADKIVVLDGDGTIKEQGTYEVSMLSLLLLLVVLLVLLLLLVTSHEHRSTRGCCCCCC